MCLLFLSFPEKLVSLQLFLVLGVGLQAESFFLQSQVLIYNLVRFRAFLSIRATGPGPPKNVLGPPNFLIIAPFCQALSYS